MAEKRYKVHRADGTQDGPYSWDQMYDLALRGELRPGTEVSDAATGQRGRADALPFGTADPGTSGMVVWDRIAGAAFCMVVMLGILWSIGAPEVKAGGPFGLIWILAWNVLQFGMGIAMIASRRFGFVLVAWAAVVSTTSSQAGGGSAVTPIQVAYGLLSFICGAYAVLRLTNCIGEPPRR